MSIRIIWIMLVIFMHHLLAGYASAKDIKEKISYKYKKYERFDLGNLEIKGSVVAPGDLSVRERKRKQFDTPLLDRRDFYEEIRDDVMKLR